MMRVSILMMIRLMVLMGLVSGVVALSLGEAERPAVGSRRGHDGRWLGLAGDFGGSGGRWVRFVDPGTGLSRDFGLPEGDRVRRASCSRWSDERGEGQVVGCWSLRTGPGRGEPGPEIGLGRYSYPGGRLLDRIATDIIPTAPPCWYPGTTARVLYSARDQALYQVDFEAATSGPAGPAPEPLAWECDRPGLGPVLLVEPCWPDAPALGDRLVVSLYLQESDRGRRRFTAPQIWWLRLDPAGTAIVAAGRLTRPASAAEEDERHPAVTALPDGRTVLAAVVGEAGTPRQRLRVAPIEVDPMSGDPTACLDGRDWLEGTLPLAPAFSADGRWVACAARERGEWRVSRFDVVAGLVAGRGGAGPVDAPGLGP